MYTVFEGYSQPGHNSQPLVKDLCAQAQIQSNAAINYGRLILCLPTCSY